MARQITVTKEGLQKLQDELNERKTSKRDEIKEAIRIAKGFGDLSENSEYDEARDAQAHNERRILELVQLTVDNLSTVVCILVLRREVDDGNTAVGVCRVARLDVVRESVALTHVDIQA